MIERAYCDEIFILNCFPNSSGKVMSEHHTQLLKFSVEVLCSCEYVSCFYCPVLSCAYHQHGREACVFLIHKPVYEKNEN